MVDFPEKQQPKLKYAKHAAPFFMDDEEEENEVSAVPQEDIDWESEAQLWEEELVGNETQDEEEITADEVSEDDFALVQAPVVRPVEDPRSQSKYGRMGTARSDETARRINSGKKKRAGLRAILIVVCTIALLAGVFSAYTLSYYFGQKQYDDLSSSMIKAPTALASASDEEISALLADTGVFWGGLLSINSDIVAWVYVPDAGISFPICLGQDNDTYLYRSFDGIQGNAIWPSMGTPFVVRDQVGTSAQEFLHENEGVYIYGRNMRSHAMFARFIEAYSSGKGFSAHSRIFVFTPQGNY
ncbi:MAG: hypothetical protein J6Y65_02855 [Eggerthellaceae bacterium]|nr:hypothetical protein [Eggerthellaceae bacterium]